jgi:hypothetical protein
MKKYPFAALTLAAALTAVPAFAQQADKPDNPKAEERADHDKAVKPEKGSVKAQEANQEKDDKGQDRAHESKIPQSDQEPGVRNPEKEAAKPGMQDRDHDSRKSDVSEKDRNVQYHFKPEAREKLRTHYKSQVSSHNRNVTIVRQEVIPVEVQTRLEPVPVELVSDLGPAPEGFQYGFVDGYVVVYDPATFFVVDVIDLF